MTRQEYSTFSTDRIEVEQIELKGEKGYYVTGYITTDEVDLYHDKVTPEAMDGIIEQLKSGRIKLDIDHSNFTEEGPEIPIGKIIEAKKVTENGKVKIWVKAQLNDAHGRFKEVWKSIKEGFMDAFSIAFYARDKATEIIEGTETKILKAVDILNVAITGNPVNRGATMSEAFYKSLHAEDAELKAKYTRRWKGKDGKWRYEYGKRQGSKDSVFSEKEVKDVWESGMNDYTQTELVDELWKYMPEKDKKMELTATREMVKESSPEFAPSDKLITEMTKEILEESYSKQELMDEIWASMPLSEKKKQARQLDSEISSLNKTKSLKSTTSEVETMAEEEAKKPEETATPDAEESKPETDDKPEEENKSLKEIAELKSLVEEQAKAIKAQKEQMAELKAQLEKPVMKGLQKETAAEKAEDKTEATANVLQFC